MTNHAPRRIGMSIGAVLAGLVAIFVLSLGTDQLFHTLGVYPSWDQPMTDTGLLILAFAYRCLYGVAGGYIAGRLAPRAPVAHALVLGAIGVVLSTLGAIAMWEMSPPWYPLALIAVSLPLSWAGGKLAARQR
ncbi:hypothetical protein [Parvibaculum sp.]|uniref:hypothetical protein n=1 Tax=Parvibaculum sp. TaxID=2024848 RepID=UPI00391D83AD